MDASQPTRELTLRALLTGMLIGALLTPCNVYSGLKIGWSFNMSIAAALLGFAFWRAAGRVLGTPRWGVLENNINQTTASSSASIISGGLVAPIPALALITGAQLPWQWLCLWVFAVSALGIVVAVALRNTVLEREQLVFPVGVATAETVREIHAEGRQARERVRALATAAVTSAAAKLAIDLSGRTLRWSPALPGPAGAASLKQLGIGLDPSLLMIGFGMIIGLRSGVSLLLGAVLAWVCLAPLALGQGWAQPGSDDAPWFGELVQWLVWPGVTLMTVSSLSGFGLQLLRRYRQRRTAQRTATLAFPVPLPAFLAGALCVGVLVVSLQGHLFGMSPASAMLAVALAFVLAVVAARVVGETGIPPIGAIGKVSQLSLGLAAPGSVTSNLMGANVTGGAAGQSADLLNDLRSGALLGATPWRQVMAQCFGVLTGSLAGCATYLLLVPDPATMLLTPEWPAPAAATWKAVAEVLAAGLDQLPPAAGPAMTIAAIVGLLLAAAETLPPTVSRWIPSGSAIGLAFVIPAWISAGLFLGALIAAIAARVASGWMARFGLAIAAGLVAGESLAGIGVAVSRMLAQPL